MESRFPTVIQEGLSFLKQTAMPNFRIDYFFLIGFDLFYPTAIFLLIYLQFILFNVILGVFKTVKNTIINPINTIDFTGNDK